MFDKIPENKQQFLKPFRLRFGLVRTRIGSVNTPGARSVEKQRRYLATIQRSLNNNVYVPTCIKKQKTICLVLINPVA